MPFDETFLREYRRRHPHLFPEDAQPAPPSPPAPLRDNGYPNEAAFQAAAVRELTALGWCVQESYKGSARGGGAWMTVGWPDLALYLPDGRRRLWFAELKQPGNKPSDDQLACHARLRAAGFRVVVAYTLAELLAAEQEERA